MRRVEFLWVPDRLVVWWDRYGDGSRWVFWWDPTFFWKYHNYAFFHSFQRFQLSTWSFRLAIWRKINARTVYLLMPLCITVTTLCKLKIFSNLLKMKLLKDSKIIISKCGPLAPPPLKLLNLLGGHRESHSPLHRWWWWRKGKFFSTQKISDGGKHLFMN